MKKIAELFNRVMIEVTSTDVAMMGKDVPVVTAKGSTWAEFETWANKALSPNLVVRGCWFSGCRTVVCARIEAFNEKSASTLKANGFMGYSITAEVDFEEDGRPYGCSLVLNIPVIPDV
jgi:hypothetical protein